jgi:flagellar M-ring protein FliF
MADQEILNADANLPISGVVTAAPQPFALQGTLSNLRGITQQPAVRRALPLLGGVLAITVAALAWWSLQLPSQRPLYEGLGEADKAAVADALQTSGVAYQVDRDTGGITVGEDDVHKARMMLASQGLPKAAPGGDAMIAALPMGSSRAVEGETLRGAREADLARTIEAIDAVKTARVHLATPEPSVFVRDTVAPAASIMLTLQTGRTLSDAQVRAIRHLVAASVTSLAPDQVSVIDQSGALLSQSDGGGDDAGFQLQLQMENRYRQAINALLGPMVGQGNFTAELHVDVDQSESQSTRESYPKDDRALRQEEGNKTSSVAMAAPATGIPGALSNQPPPPSQLSNQPSAPSASAGSSNGNQSAETYTRSFDVGREISVTHQPVGKVRRLTVAVALRDLKGSKAHNPTELASLEALIKGAVGFDAARGDVVALSAGPFAEAEVIVEHFWDAPWFMVVVRQLGALIVALLTLLFVGRPMLKAFRRRTSEEAAHSANGSGVTSGQAQLSAERQITLEMIEAAPSYADRATLVRDFVKQDPTRATLVVRQLMQEVANG